MCPRLEAKTMHASFCDNNLTVKGMQQLNSISPTKTTKNYRGIAFPHNLSYMLVARVPTVLPGSIFTPMFPRRTECFGSFSDHGGVFHEVCIEWFLTPEKRRSDQIPASSWSRYVAGRFSLIYIICIFYRSGAAWDLYHAALSRMFAGYNLYQVCITRLHFITANNVRST